MLPMEAITMPDSLKLETLRNKDGIEEDNVLDNTT